MNFSRGQRAAVSRAQAARLQLSVSRLPATFRQSLVISHPRDGITARNMWWWSRRHDCSMDEDMEERFLRHQKLMRNRYSKLLRRRSIWEGSEHTQSPVWARSRRWLVTRWADKKALSYQRALQAGMQDPARRTNDERPWKEWDSDFNEKLKSRIDEDLDRDSCGAPFGRHLNGPPSPNHSSWMSFSWIYGPLKSMQKGVSSMSPDGMPDLTARAFAATTPNERKTFSVPPRAPCSNSSRESRTEPEHEFDPTFTRKVPKQEEASLNRVQPCSAGPSLPPRKKALLEILFSQHGVDIPVKTYEPHKVYGHRGFEPATANTSRAAATPERKIRGIDLENSRLRDLQALKFKTLGNSIDTTAEYGGKYRNPADPEPIHITSAKDEPGFPGSGEVSKRHHGKLFSGADDSALLAGTTYETKAKANASISISKPSFKTSWLEKEGFQTLRQALTPSESSQEQSKISTEVKATAQLPSVEAALNRVQASDVKPRNKQEGTKHRELLVPTDTVEDLDLLRASDVRAATRSARMTRHEIEQGKQATRKNLELVYSEQQPFDAPNSAVNAETTRHKVSKGLSSVWDHMKQYPQGIVAKTISGMGIFNENYKTYERLEKPAQASTEKLVFKDETLSKSPSIFKKISKRSGKPLQTFTPSQEFIDLERAERARSASLRQVNEESKNRALIERRKAAALAADIRSAYEELYGKIDINHRQAAAISHDSADTVSAPALSRTDVTQFRKAETALQSMGPATIKPGVTEDPVMKNHVGVFEPKLAKIVDDAKSVRKAIHEAKLEVMAIRSRRPQTIWSGRSTDAASISVPTSASLRIEPALDRSTEKQFSKATIKPAASISSPKYTSEYIVLAYNRSSNDVTASPLDSSMSSAQKTGLETGVTEILAGLNHTAKFLSHFANLSQQGYQVVSGGGDVLLFQKRSMKVPEPPLSPLLTHVKAIIDKNKLAAQEASAQPMAKVLPVKTMTSHENLDVKEAATVLDKIPAPEPRPSPASPTMPPIGPPFYMRPKVRRQEDVFSASKASRVSPPPVVSTEKTPGEDGARKTPKIQVGMWTRFKRGVKRVVLTAAAMGASAYTIGVVAERLGAQQPPEKAIGVGRPGMYSTENSR